MRFVINSTSERLREPISSDPRNILMTTIPALKSRNTINLTGQPSHFDYVKMLCKENNKTGRRVKEAAEIYNDGPALNRDHGHEVPPILQQLISHHCPSHWKYLAIPPFDQVIIVK